MTYEIQYLILSRPRAPELPEPLGALDKPRQGVSPQVVWRGGRWSAGAAESLIPSRHERRLRR